MLETDTIAVRSADRMPPLLQRLSERKPETLEYLGVSFGLTRELLRFWRRCGFVPLYASQKENDLTGEYSFVMLKGLSSGVAQAEGWLSSFSQGLSLLGPLRYSVALIKGRLSTSIHEASLLRLLQEV